MIDLGITLAAVDQMAVRAAGFDWCFSCAGALAISARRWSCSHCKRAGSWAKHGDVIVRIVEERGDD